MLSRGLAYVMCSVIAVCIKFHDHCSHPTAGDGGGATCVLFWAKSLQSRTTFVLDHFPGLSTGPDSWKGLPEKWVYV